MEGNHCIHNNNTVDPYVEVASLASISSDRGQSTFSSKLTEGNKPKPYDSTADRQLAGKPPANVPQGIRRTRAASLYYELAM